MKGVVPLVALLVVLSGCLTEEKEVKEPTDPDAADEGPWGDADSEDTRQSGPATAPAKSPRAPAKKPDNLDVTATMTGSLDPMNLVLGEICETPTAQCDRHEFKVEGGEWIVDVDLTWTIPVQDFDLYLYDGLTELTRSGNNPPDFEGFTYVVDRGTYELVVVGWAVVNDEYHLTANFVEP